jgi:hypothetical protein
MKKCWRPPFSESRSCLQKTVWQVATGCQNTVIAEAGSEVIWEVVKQSTPASRFTSFAENQDIYPPL